MLQEQQKSSWNLTLYTHISIIPQSRQPFHNGAHPDYSRHRHVKPLDNSVGVKLTDHFDIWPSWIIAALDCTALTRSASFVDQSLPNRVLGAVQCDAGSAHTSGT
jgi:hypothetical protein